MGGEGATAGFLTSSGTLKTHLINEKFKENKMVKETKLNLNKHNYQTTSGEYS